jgi:hypothetical protein
MIAFGPLFSLDAKATSEKVIRRLAAADKIGVRMAFGCDVVVDVLANNLPT